MFADYDHPDGTNSVANIYRKLFVSLVTRGYAEIYKNFFIFVYFFPTDNSCIIVLRIPLRYMYK